MQLKQERVIPRLRALLTLPGGEVLGFRGPWLVRLKTPFDRVEKLALLPAGWKRMASRSWLATRLARLDVFRLERTPTGVLFAISSQGVMKLAAGDREFRVAFRGYRGGRPLSLCVDSAGRIYVGEYFDNPQRDKVHVFMSDDDGETWAICYTFPRSSIRHVHHLEWDAARQAMWVLTGDYGDEAQIALAAPKFANYTIIAQGSQQTRALACVPTETGLYYATDTPLEQNHIYYLDMATRQTRSVGQVQQSVFFMTSACGGMWLSTVVEPSEANPTQSVHLWFSRDGAQWSELLTAPRDRLSLKYFQYPAIFLAKSSRDYQHVFLSFRGCRGLDGDCVVASVTE